jgi:predicted nucleic acid-binding protein
MKIFIDTGAFIALTDTDDANYQSAKEFYKDAIINGIRFVTTNFVICETLNYLRARISYKIAVAFRENLKKSSHFDTVTILPPVENESFAIFKSYSDKDFSFTDCTSFVVMKSLKLTKAFAFDRHFEQFGKFERLP